MKRDTKRLDLVKQVFAKREQVLAKEMGQFQLQLDHAVQQLSQLRDHRNRPAATLRAGLSTDPGRLQNQQVFQERLNKAIEQQEMLIERAEVERAELRRRWLARRRKTLSVEKLCEIRCDEVLSQEIAREQKHQDETASRSRLKEVD